MGSALPPIPKHEFEERLSDCTGLSLDESHVRALYKHYTELRRWNPRLSLVGPGTANSVVERHYGESLAALSLLPTRPHSILDIGSGAGFPAMVLGVIRPDVSVTLTEPRSRKWAFLKIVAQRIGLSCRCLNVRVEPPLDPSIPSNISVITSRALAIPRETLAALGDSFPTARMLLWCTEPQPDISSELAISNQLSLKSGDKRQLVSFFVRKR